MTKHDLTFNWNPQKTFLYRLTMIGLHEVEAPEELLSFKEHMIEKINSHCYDEPASGVCVIFPKQFLHVLEVSKCD